MGTLEGRVALITGAGQGSGRGLALALAAQGASIAVVGRTESKLHLVADEVRDRGVPSIVERCDVSDAAQIDATVDAVVGAFGRIDILVNAAHHNVRAGKLLEMRSTDIELLWKTGPLAALHFMRRCYPHLRGGGSIVNFGSATQFEPANYGVYAAMKDAIRTISRAAAVEWGPDQIRVNVIAPLVESPSAAAQRAERGESTSNPVATPLGRMGDPEADIGRVAAFLASDDASYVTGQFITLDGGFAYHR